jgi:putative membrane protein
MRPTALLRIGIAVITIAAAGCSKADGQKQRSAAPPAGGTAAVGTGGAGATVRDDDDFVRDVAMKNRAETELSRMALDKSAAADVKTFAQMMVDDHSAAGNKLESVASGARFELPAQLDDKHRKIADDLSAKQGVEFDREYMKAMIDGHQDLIAKLESRLDVQSVADWKTAAAKRDDMVRPIASGDGVTMKINQWAAETYPVAQKHLDAARTLENAVKRRSTD